MTIPRCLFLLQTQQDTQQIVTKKIETALPGRSHSSQSSYMMEIREPGNGTIGSSRAAATSFILERPVCKTDIWAGLLASGSF
jgi:hypothetical protein